MIFFCILVFDDEDVFTGNTFHSLTVGSKMEAAEVWVLEAIKKLSASTFVLKGSKDSLDRKSMVTSIGLTIWFAPKLTQNRTEIDGRLTQLQEMTSGMKENTIMVVDKHGTFWQMHDKSRRRIELKNKNQRKMIIFQINE